MTQPEKFLRGYVVRHYEQFWRTGGRNVNFTVGPRSNLPKDFGVLEFEPHADRSMWTYATCCMSSENDDDPIELHIFSPKQSIEPVELLVATAHYHRTVHLLGVGHTVNFGKPWIEDSPSEYGLISLPYLDGPELENLELPNGKVVQCLWLIPIMKSEVDFKKKKGLEALENCFEEARFDYLDPKRRSVC